MRRRFLKVLSVGYCSPSGKVCANCFTRDNIHKVNAEDTENPTVDLLTLSLSGGGLRLPLIEAKVDKEKRRVSFQWQQQPLMPSMAKEDRLMGVIHEREEKKSRLVELGTRGTQRGKRMAATGRLGRKPTGRVRFRCQRERAERSRVRWGYLETNGEA